MNKANQDKLYDARPHPMTHAIIAVMLGREPQTPAKYVGHAYITSDGFVMCDFVDSDGRYHMGAFVAGYSEVEKNVLHVADVIGVPEDETRELIREWVGRDYRS